MKSDVILLVEDNVDDVKQTLRSFTRNNIANEVVVARDGAEALDYLFGKGAFAGRDPGVQPGLILLDLKLPRVSGFEVLERLRASPLTAHVPVVVLTSSREERDMMQSYSLGANIYVHKPVQFAEFLNAARYLGLYWTLLGSGLALVHRETTAPANASDVPRPSLSDADLRPARPLGASLDIRPLQVLVTTPDAQLSRLIRDVLVGDGHIVDEARDARSAFRRVLSSWPDALIVDVQLPDLSGVEVVRALRESPQGQSVAAVLLAPDVNRARRDIADAAVRVVPKPVDVLLLADRMRELRLSDLVRDISEEWVLPTLHDDEPRMEPVVPKPYTFANDAWELLGVPRGAPQNVVAAAVDGLIEDLTGRARNARNVDDRSRASAMAARLRAARGEFLELCRGQHQEQPAPREPLPGWLDKA